MPWSNQNGGGGPWGGGSNNGGSPWGSSDKGNGDNKNPWGKKPSGSGGGDNGNGGGGRGPDFDEMLRKGQQSLKQAGGGMIALIIIVLVVAFWLFQCFYTVKPYQGAIELFLGQPKNQILGQGLHFHFWPLESVSIVDRSQKQVTIGDGQNGFMLSSDQNIVNVRFAVRYNVENPAEYLFNVESPDQTLMKISESAMREVVGRRPVNDIYRDNRVAIAQEVQKIVQDTLNTYRSGIIVAGVTIEDAAPPRDVVVAFEAVQKADQERSRLVNTGNQYKEKRLGEANSRAARIQADAVAYKDRIVQEAQGETQRFTSLYKEAEKAEDVTRLRLYLETMETILSSKNKLLIDPAAAKGVVPYLPLNEMIKTTGNANASEGK